MKETTKNSTLTQFKKKKEREKERKECLVTNFRKLFFLIMRT